MITAKSNSLFKDGKTPIPGVNPLVDTFTVDVARNNTNNNSGNPRLILGCAVYAWP